MRYLVIVLILAQAGCGVEQLPRSGLAEGLYFGRLDCIEQVISSSADPRTANDFREGSVAISSSGLPMFEGVEVYVGMRRSTRLSFLLDEDIALSLTNVIVTPDGVQLAWTGEFADVSGRCQMEASETFKPEGKRGMRCAYTFRLTCTDAGGSILGAYEGCNGVMIR